VGAAHTNNFPANIRLGPREDLPGTPEWLDKTKTKIWQAQGDVITCLLQGKGVPEPLSLGSLSCALARDLTYCGHYELAVRSFSLGYLTTSGVESTLKIESNTELGRRLTELVRHRNLLAGSTKRDPDGKLFLDQDGTPLFKSREGSAIHDDAVDGLFLALRDTVIEDLCRHCNLAFNTVIRLTVGSIDTSAANINIPGAHSIKISAPNRPEILERLRDLSMLATRCHNYKKDCWILPPTAEEMPLFWSHSAKPLEQGLINSSWNDPRRTLSYGHKSA
jgi:hypothetical protein